MGTYLPGQVLLRNASRILQICRSLYETMTRDGNNSRLRFLKRSGPGNLGTFGTGRDRWIWISDGTGSHLVSHRNSYGKFVGKQDFSRGISLIFEREAYGKRRTLPSLGIFSLWIRNWDATRKVIDVSWNLGIASYVLRAFISLQCWALASFSTPRRLSR